MIFNTDGLSLLESKKISILFVGNSMTQDGIAYLPYMLHTYFPEIDFRFYLWYMAGYKLSQQYTAFQNNTKADIFSVAENSASWTNYNSQKTMDDVLENYQFDIVCMQEYFTGRTSYNVEDLDDWNNCRDYIIDNYGGNNSLEFISLFHAPSCNTPVDANFEMIKKGNSLILKNTIAQDMIPMGIAKYRALATSLDSLGDAGHLTVDGGHAQEGLPCLLQTLCAMCWMFDKLGINQSIYGIDARITTAIYQSINVPGPNLGTGVITGTDAQNIIAQEVAIKAYEEGRRLVLGTYQEDGLSTDAKTALLECLQHMAWIDTDGIDYFNNLCEALGIVPEPTWDYSWDASSGTNPPDMTGYSFNFNDDPGAVKVIEPDLTLSHSGSFEFIILCKFAYNEGTNSPYFAINHTDDDTHNYSMQIHANNVTDVQDQKNKITYQYNWKSSTKIFTSYDQTTYREYRIIVENGVLNFYIDNNLVSTHTYTDSSSHTNTNTVRIFSATSPGHRYSIHIKKIRFREISTAE